MAEEQEHARELVGELLVRAGMLMEDISVAVVSRLPQAAAEYRARVRAIAMGGIAVGALTLAAWCLSAAAEREEAPGEA